MPGETQTTLPKEAITCHVLNTFTGQPGSGLAVVLQCTGQGYDAFKYTGVTDQNGRVGSWDIQHPTLDNNFPPRYVLDYCKKQPVAEGTKPELLWTMKFDAGKYFKDQGLEDPGWWEVVEIRFKTVVGGEGARDHWHVPLLLSPYSYTTYRGS